MIVVSDAGPLMALAKLNALASGLNGTLQIA